MGRTQAGKFLLWKGRLRGTPGLDCIWWGSNSRKRGASCGKTSSRPTPASFFLVFHSGSGMRKIVFQVIQYKPFQILVESFVAERVATSPSVFHFRIRTSFQVPGFEWVHELLLLCLTSNSAQFCAEIACGKTALGHNCTDSRFRMKNDFSVCRRGASRLTREISGRGWAPILLST